MLRLWSVWGMPLGGVVVPGPLVLFWMCFLFFPFVVASDLCRSFLPANFLDVGDGSV